MVFGLLAATCQSLCYVFTRIFVTKPGNNSRVLFGLSHAWMGLFALIVLPFCYSAKSVEAGHFIWPLLGAAVFYLLGQVCLFQSIRFTDASRVSPLLGLKILILAFIAAVFFHETVTPWQWVAVVLCVMAALMLNRSGGSIPWQALVIILGACLWYSFSDLSIVKLNGALAPDREFKGILLGASLCYMVTGVVGLGIVWRGGPAQRSADKWKSAFPVALTWFLAMLFLFVCFGFIGAVFGNIVQAMRGPISIVIGMLVARLGHVHLEQRIPPGVLLRRIVASVLMVVAFALYVLNKPLG